MYLCILFFDLACIKLDKIYSLIKGKLYFKTHSKIKSGMRKQTQQFSVMGDGAVASINP